VTLKSSVTLKAEECQEYGIFENYDNVREVFIQYNPVKAYVTVKIFYSIPKPPTEINVPNQFYYQLLKKREKGLLGPVVIYAKKRKSLLLHKENYDDMLCDSISWGGDYVNAYRNGTKILHPSNEIVEIKNTKLDDVLKKGEFEIDDPSCYKLFLAPTAKNRKQAALAFTNHMIIFPGATLSLPLNITLSGAIIPILAFTNADDFMKKPENMIWFSPKIGLYNHKYYSIACGGFRMAFESESSKLTEIPTYVYLVQTFGPEYLSVTAGVGRLRTGNEFLDEYRWIYGLESRIGKNVKFMAENWALGHGYNFGVIGAKLFSRRTSLEVGFLFRYIEHLESPFYVESGIPFVSFSFTPLMIK